MFLHWNADFSVILSFLNITANNTTQDSFLPLSPGMYIYSFSSASISFQHAFRGKKALYFPLWMSFIRIKKLEQVFMWMPLCVLDQRSQCMHGSSWICGSRTYIFSCQTSLPLNTPLIPLTSSCVDDVNTQQQKEGEPGPPPSFLLSFRFLGNHSLKAFSAEMSPMMLSLSEEHRFISNPEYQPLFDLQNSTYFPT